MNKHYKKTMWASIVAFLLGISCCWLSALAIWIGGATVLTVVSSYLSNAQIPILAIAVLLLCISLYLYRKK